MNEEEYEERIEELELSVEELEDKISELEEQLSDIRYNNSYIFSEAMEEIRKIQTSDNQDDINDAIFWLKEAIEKLDV